MTDVRMTEYSHGAGCACKLGPDELARVMGTVNGHPASSHPDLLVGPASSDDAGIFDIGDGRALVQTVDIFTPVVDSPSDWGRIAAANALSDVYAMGGTPLTALQYLAWPRDKLDLDLAADVVSGGMAVMASAGCTVVGGHSIDSPEPTYGFAVTGMVGSDSFFPNSRAEPGDTLILTKPLGIGVITTAIKRGKCPPNLATTAIEFMTMLNDVAGNALSRSSAHAATDVTGFGLLGHLREMCLASDVSATIALHRVPVLDGTRELLEEGMWAGGSARNLKSVLEFVESEVGEDDLKLLVDAQTSGGLLVAVPPESAGEYFQSVPGSALIGRVEAGTGITVTP
ncbi:MAG TPA: selenide, water dikinase SelD [Acidimicrobiia bacterium]|nr:selenide, water dikinase SelD [Acidimicrobiia bacterium]